ncbi:GNAT family N-acetyltransferase [Hylemonella gracilis]|uniref:Acetyltransferase n=1 Tax=Hylemonella gracilis ATCC 19624 TaxID=887062 RepID=F3KWF9_9BURK|nr:GNAT family N-acetyltransferase [Hylemonella gracilis]EGI75866.1 acetyltransferase [Hylemonella gracilis ATCC 19624]
MPDIALSNNAAQHRYEIASGGTLAGFAEYNLVGQDAVLFSHTEILAAFEGQGLGSQLARYALDDVKAQNKMAIPVCKFIAGYIRRHPEYLAIVRPDARAAFLS